MSDENRLTSPKEKEEDDKLETSLRPRSFQDYVGQERIKKNLDIAILAAKKRDDLAAILTNLEPGDILFIDEIHRLPKVVEEILYPAMEDFALDIIMGKGPSARTLRLDLPHFTIVGATTLASLLSSPLRDRFGLSYHLNFYENKDIEKIIQRSAGILAVSY